MISFRQGHKGGVSRAELVSLEEEGVSTLRVAVRTKPGRAPQQSQACWHLEPGLPSLPKGEEERWSLNHPGGGVLLGQREKRRTINHHGLTKFSFTNKTAGRIVK